MALALLVSQSKLSSEKEMLALITDFEVEMEFRLIKRRKEWEGQWVSLSGVAVNVKLLDGERQGWSSCDAERH